MICVRFRCARARGTKKVRHAFRPVKMHTKLASGRTRATRNSPKIVRKTMRKRMRAQTSQKRRSERCPLRLGIVPGRPGSVPECPETPRERPGSVPGAPRGVSGASRECPRGAPNRPRSPRAPPERFLDDLEVDFGAIWGRFGVEFWSICGLFCACVCACVRACVRLFVRSLARTLARALNETRRCATEVLTRPFLRAPPFPMQPSKQT